MVKMLIVVLRTISHSQIFLLKNVNSSHFFSKNIRVYAIFNDQSFYNLLTSCIISFEQLGPGCLRFFDIIRAERTKKRFMVQFENVF